MKVKSNNLLPKTLVAKMLPAKTVEDAVARYEKYIEPIDKYYGVRWGYDGQIFSLFDYSNKSAEFEI